jgi:hypothetical protein
VEAVLLQATLPPVSLAVSKVSIRPGLYSPIAGVTLGRIVLIWVNKKVIFLTTRSTELTESIVRSGKTAVSTFIV